MFFLFFFGISAKCNNESNPVPCQVSNGGSECERVVDISECVRECTLGRENDEDHRQRERETEGYGVCR